MEEPSAGPPDSALIARALAGGDRHAFAALVRRHQGPVRALLRRLTKNDEALADDLAQETFIQAWRKLASFRADARFSTWLYRIAYNAFLMHARARKDEEPLDETTVEADEEAEAGRQPEAHAADLQMDLQRALER